MKKKLKIALAEDNRFHAILFEQATRSAFPEADLTIYTSAVALLEALTVNRYDLIVVDFNLPDMGGLDLMSRIQLTNPDLPVVVITGSGSEEVAVEAMKLGAADYISKTGDYDVIIPQVIKQACQKQKLILKNRRLENRAREMERLETITALVSTLNHEINNPLMAIHGNVELLLENTAGPESAEREKLEMIEKSARRIMDITHQMAHLMTASIRQTPAGPMLRLKEKGRDRRQKLNPAIVPVDKTN
ncbi:MAG: response regulator [FCB group bacterium]|nr:response regulator [FCB group bacterium]